MRFGSREGNRRMLGLEFARDFCPYNSTDFFSFLFLRSQRRPSFVSLSSGTLVPSLSVFVADGDTSPGCGRHRAMTPGCSRHRHRTPDRARSGGANPWRGGGHPRRPDRLMVLARRWMESGRRRPEAPARWGRTSARRLLESARLRTTSHWRTWSSQVLVAATSVDSSPRTTSEQPSML